MNKVKIAVAAAHIAVLDFFAPREAKVESERGSLTLEQIIWTVAIALIAIAIVAIVVSKINSKAAELPL